MSKVDRLRKRRDELLVKKFHELYDIKKIRYEKVMEELEWNWFFIDQKTIWALIRYNEENFELYQSLLEKNNTKQLELKLK